MHTAVDQGRQDLILRGASVDDNLMSVFGVFMSTFDDH